MVNLKFGCCPLLEIHIYINLCRGPIRALQTLHCNWSPHKFAEVNFLNLADSNQIFRIDFVCIYYHLCEISSQIIECKIFAPYDFLAITLYNYLLYGTTINIPPQLPSTTTTPQLLQSKRRGEESKKEEPQKLSYSLILAHSLLDWIPAAIYTQVLPAACRALKLT